MLSIKECQKHLEKGGKKYHINQVKEIREFLYILAGIESKINEHEKGSNLL